MKKKPNLQSCLMFLLVVIVYFFIGLPSVTAVTFESSQYRIETIKQDTAHPALTRDEDVFLTKGYLLDQSETVDPFDLREPAGLSLSSPLVKLLIKPGQSVTVSYEIENQADPELISFRVVSLEPANDEIGFKLKNLVEGPIQLTGPAPQFMTDTRQKVDLKIQVPENTPEKDYYYGMMVEKNISARKTKNHPSPNDQNLFSVILMTVTEKLTPIRSGSKIDASLVIKPMRLQNSLRLSLFGQDFHVLDSFDSTAGLIKVVNPTNHFSQIKGQIKVKKPFGKQSVFGLKPFIVLAHASTSTEVALTGFKFGRYEVIGQIGRESQSLTRSSILYVVPMKLGLILLVLVLILLKS